MRSPVTGAEYVRLLGESPERRVFQQIALALAAPRANIFDFGSGPGVDAAAYAQLGHTVEAYDHDPAMREYFAQHCQELIAAGRVRQHDGTYPEFLSAGGSGWADLITSNYAPLNLIEDLAGLFKRLHALSRGCAWLLASVLNPLSISDIRYPWWRRNVGNLLVRGEYFVEGEYGRIYRRSVRRMAELAVPQFRLLGAIPNAPRALKYIQLPRTVFVSRASRAVVMTPYVLVVFERVIV
jgi:SAM-dependent methyltransferase